MDIHGLLLFFPYKEGYIPIELIYNKSSIWKGWDTSYLPGNYLEFLIDINIKEPIFNICSRQA